MIRFCFALIGASIWLATPSQAGTFTPELFDRWIDARVGTGDPVYWYSTGTLRSYPDGKIIAKVEGYDTVRMYRPDPAKSLVHQYNRKIYIYRDPKTGEVLREVGGKKVEPVAYPYQFISYELKDGELETFVEQGSGTQVNRIGPGRDISVRMLGDTAVFTAPIYLDFPIGPNRRYQAFENYDFFVQPKGSVKQPHQLSWVRYGDAPPWAGGGPSIMHLVTWRVDRFANVPETLRSYIQVEAPLWQVPPRDLNEIRSLQKGGDGGGNAAANLAKFMIGRFASKADQAGNKVADFRHPIVPLGKGEWVYYQRNQGTGDLTKQTKAYRQRILQMVERPDGTVAQYTWSLKEPDNYASAPDNPDILTSLELDELTPTMEAGCDQIWRSAMLPTPASDPGEQGWVGRVDPAQCTIFSKRRGMRIGIESQTLLTRDSLQEAERGFHLDGTQIWGTPRGKFTSMARLVVKP